MTGMRYERAQGSHFGHSHYTSEVEGEDDLGEYDEDEDDEREIIMQ